VRALQPGCPNDHATHRSHRGDRRTLRRASPRPKRLPNRPIRYIVASAPGGIADITPRVLAPRLAEALRQPVVVENRPGGGIVAGGEAVAKALPDGYTLLSATPQVAIVQSMVKDLAFDPRRDLAPVALVGVIPNVLVAGRGRPRRRSPSWSSSRAAIPASSITRRPAPEPRCIFPRSSSSTIPAPISCTCPTVERRRR